MIKFLDQSKFSDVRVRGLELLFFRKILLTYLMDDPKLNNSPAAIF